MYQKGEGKQKNLVITIGILNYFVYELTPSYEDA